jgi:hypothetical protein
MKTKIKTANCGKYRHLIVVFLYNFECKMQLVQKKDKTLEKY